MDHHEHMRTTDERQWAKEEMLFAIDENIRELFDDPVNGATTLDSQTVLLKRRNRVAKFLGIGKPKTLNDFSKKESPG